MTSRLCSFLFLCHPWILSNLLDSNHGWTSEHVDADETLESSSAFLHRPRKLLRSLHKNGEPSLRSFMEVFGEKLQRHLVTLEPITADDILRTLNKTKPSAAGLDHFLPGELKILAKWAPSLMVKLAQLFAVIESTSKWPKVLVKGSVSFIPKTDDVENLSADQYRPITILSAIYRLWSSIRHDQLVESWYARWHHPQAFGGKDSRPADVLAFEVSLQLAEALQSQKFVGGVSYDLQKCFDSVPTNLCLQIFRIRGAPNLVVDSMLSFYQQHEKYFKIDGCYSGKFKPVNGIIQGDPMSMLLLVSLITSWLENQPSQLTSTTGRSYVDDLSTISLSDSLKELKTAVQVSHQYTCDFVRQVGMTMNHSKTFTFGNPKLKNILPNVDSHKEQFRLVGGSIKSSTKTTWTHLEQQRQDKWQSTMARIRFVPKGWFTKVKLMQKYTSQLTWGQGTHSLSLSVNRQRALRASVIKSLLNVTDYSASPKVIFCLLAPPALEAEYALHLSALRLVMRIYSSPEKRHQLDDLVAQLPPNAIDGPYKRIAQLRAHPIFANTYQKFIADQLHPNKWQHELREDFRKHHWQLLCRDRGHHFGGTTRGVKKNLTTHLLQKWAQEADSMDNSIIDPENDPRPCMKILRLLLAGGLMTPERDHRHRRKQGKVLCSCGEATPDVIHISWHCKKYQQLRSRAIEVLPKPLNQLPVCFQYATIVPVDLDIDQAALTIIQTTLVTIWQRHITSWTEDLEDFQVLTAETIPHATANVSETIEPVQSKPVGRKGHVLKLLPGNGVFCVKCGKQTALLKHQRLKITNKPCKYSQLPQEQWLSSPGAFKNIHRIQTALHELNTVHNKGNHSLIWNEKCGKDRKKSDTFGKIWCKLCNREWPRMHRHSNHGV